MKFVQSIIQVVLLCGLTYQVKGQFQKNIQYAQQPMLFNQGFLPNINEERIHTNYPFQNPTLDYLPSVTYYEQMEVEILPEETNAKQEHHSNFHVPENDNNFLKPEINLIPNNIPLVTNPQTLEITHPMVLFWLILPHLPIISDVQRKHNNENSFSSLIEIKKENENHLQTHETRLKKFLELLNLMSQNLSTNQPTYPEKRSEERKIEQIVKLLEVFRKLMEFKKSLGKNESYEDNSKENFLEQISKTQNAGNYQKPTKRPIIQLVEEYQKQKLENSLSKKEAPTVKSYKKENDSTQIFGEFYSKLHDLYQKKIRNTNTPHKEEALGKDSENFEARLGEIYESEKLKTPDSWPSSMQETTDTNNNIEIIYRNAKMDDFRKKVIKENLGASILNLQLFKKSPGVIRNSDVDLMKKPSRLDKLFLESKYEDGIAESTAVDLHPYEVPKVLNLLRNADKVDEISMETFKTTTEDTAEHFESYHNLAKSNQKVHTFSMEKGLDTKENLRKIITELENLQNTGNRKNTSVTEFNNRKNQTDFFKDYTSQKIDKDIIYNLQKNAETYQKVDPKMQKDNSEKEFSDKGQKNTSKSVIRKGSMDENIQSINMLHHKALTSGWENRQSKKENNSNFNSSSPPNLPKDKSKNFSMLEEENDDENFLKEDDDFEDILKERRFLELAEEYKKEYLAKNYGPVIANMIGLIELAQNGSSNSLNTSSVPKKNNEFNFTSWKKESLATPSRAQEVNKSVEIPKQVPHGEKFKPSQSVEFQPHFKILQLEKDFIGDETKPDYFWKDTSELGFKTIFLEQLKKDEEKPILRQHQVLGTTPILLEDVKQQDRSFNTISPGQTTLKTKGNLKDLPQVKSSPITIEEVTPSKEYENKILERTIQELTPVLNSQNKTEKQNLTSNINTVLPKTVPGLLKKISNRFNLNPEENKSVAEVNSSALPEKKVFINPNTITERNKLDTNPVIGKVKLETTPSPKFRFQIISLDDKKVDSDESSTMKPVLKAVNFDKELEKLKYNFGNDDLKPPPNGKLEDKVRAPNLGSILTSFPFQVIRNLF